MCHDRDVRLIGLARDRGAPAELLLRLLAMDCEEIWFALCGRAQLPDMVTDAIVAHPIRTIRWAFSKNLRIGPEKRSRLADDPDPRIRAALVEHCVYRYHVATLTPRTPLTVEAYERLAADPEVVVREEVALQHYTPDHVRALLTADPSPAVRVCLAESWWLLTDEVKDALLNDPDTAVRRAAEKERDEEHNGKVVSLRPGSEISAHDAERAALPRPLAKRLARHADSRLRAAVAANPRLPADLIAELAVDPDAEVRLAVSARPGLTEEQRAAIDYRLDPDKMFRPLIWVRELCDDQRAMRECAESAHPSLRRSAACCPHLPPDLVERLAADEDFVVRLFLAENHPEPPGALLLRTVLEFEGYTQGMMLDNPNFPREGLRRFADSPHPDERRLVPLDLGTPAEEIERLSHDNDRRVRQAMARDPRLSTGRLLELLAEKETAEAAAGNPALPITVMKQILNGFVEEPEPSPA
ncbi:LRV domain-containing protein [Actinomadura alba]|uniref:LRV domain-containing protein n=1 Tax=Actinomadura alba TaxID=406431 RepID=A0ABR7LVY2_9ACTN|nr:LRV domain-containing protein [Actinomadura alba]MBC6468939.1 LRV domain-containing protein [Actinomadura alba]